MAVIHVTEEEAARDLPALLAKARAGEEIHIGSGSETVAVVQPPRPAARKTLTDAIRWAKEQNLQVLLDDKFGEDLEQVICNHEREGFRNPWED